MMDFKWRYGIAIAISAGLASCYMDGYNAPRSGDTGPQVVKTGTYGTTANPNERGAAVKKGGGEPVQQARPGPKPTAAPQLPVIQ